ncbi:hypothetical protein ACQ4PT_011203 [Festuca glaucescens]
MLRCEADVAAAVEGVTPRPCATKIRKRCALSSSSGASDTLSKLRLKRGVVLLHRRGSSPCLRSRRKMSESSLNGRCRSDEMHSSVSARKLVSALWQMNEGGLLEEEEAGIARDAAARWGSAAHRRCASSVERSRRKSNVLDDDHGEWFSDRLSNGGRIGVHACAADSSSTCSLDRTAHLQDMYHSLTASKELVRVLSNIWGPGVLNPSTASLLSALRSELDHARAHARQLAKEQSRRVDEVEHLKKRLAAEVHAWKSKQREKVAATVRVLADQLDGEKRSRRRAERVNAKLGKALAETESSLEAAERELQRERRSRERLEKVCDELMRGAASSSSTADRGGDVEEMWRESERAQAELDKEREMLRLADELREERVQMKLHEARIQFEEKNAVVELLRGELEAFLETRKQDHQESSDAGHDHQASEVDGANGIAHVAVSKRTDGEDDDDHEEDDSGGSDMHSIELNMDGNIKDCGWSYSTAANSKNMSTSKKAASAGSTGTECAVNPWAGASFDRRSLEESERGQQWDVDDEGCSDTTRDIGEDSERYLAIKNLREQMLAGHGFMFMSPADEGNADSEQQRYGVI